MNTYSIIAGCFTLLMHLTSAAENSYCGYKSSNCPYHSVDQYLNGSFLKNTGHQMLNQKRSTNIDFRNRQPLILDFPLPPCEVDNDNDGVNICLDCDDNDPSNTTIMDSIVYYRDIDADGYGTSENQIRGPAVHQWGIPHTMVIVMTKILKFIRMRSRSAMAKTPTAMVFRTVIWIKIQYPIARTIVW
jgi:hypothetical protein